VFGDLEKTENNPVRPLFPLIGSEAEPVPSSPWDDKETFLRHAFTVDSKKGSELLFKQYYKPLCNHAVRFVYSKEIAEDIVCDVFYTFWSKQLYDRVTSSFRAYLFIAVRNRCLKHLRKEFGKTDTPIDQIEIEYSSPTPLQLVQFNEFSHKIDKVIQSLPAQCQKVFLMNRFEGKKYKEIAEELNLSVKTVEAHISRALDVLRRAVQNDYTNFF
jgi:RNA polymerase sigma-70 factor (family 1)